MLQPDTTTTPKKDTDLLCDELLAKLTEEWPTKWASNHGEFFDGPNNVPSLEAFLDALRMDIGLTLAQRWGDRQAVIQNISNDTLSRFFDETYHKTFTRKTLNILAMYAGYVDFADFQQQQQTTIPAPAQVIKVYALLAPANRRWLEQPGVTYQLPPCRRPADWLWLVVLLAGLLTWAGYPYLRAYWSDRPLTSADISSLKFTVAGQNHAYNPAKVTFAYDFSQLNIDTLTVYFGGNKGVAEHNFVKLTQPVGTYTFDFYKPGLHLIEANYGQQVLRRVPVYVRSHGWACWYLTPNWVNTNLAYHRFYKNGGLFLHPNELPNASHRNDYNVWVRRTQPFGIQTDSLTVEYDLKYSPDEYAISCYTHQLELGFANRARFYLNFGRAGCGNFTPKGAPPRRKVTDYSLEFARLFYEWAHLKMQWKANRLRVWVNNELLTDSPNNVPNGRLVDLGFISKGSAMYDNVRLSNSYTGRTVFSDTFDTVPKSTGGY